jgi:hypothetical protein
LVVEIKINVVSDDSGIEEEIAQLKNACNNNSQVTDSWGVVEAIVSKFGPPSNITANPHQDIPF